MRRKRQVRRGIKISYSSHAYILKYTCHHLCHLETVDVLETGLTSFHSFCLLLWPCPGLSFCRRRRDFTGGISLWYLDVCTPGLMTKMMKGVLSPASPSNFSRIRWNSVQSQVISSQKVSFAWLCLWHDCLSSFSRKSLVCDESVSGVARIFSCGFCVERTTEREKRSR